MASQNLKRALRAFRRTMETARSLEAKVRSDEDERRARLCTSDACEGYSTEDAEVAYCPRCGAKMPAVEDSVGTYGIPGRQDEDEDEDERRTRTGAGSNIRKPERNTLRGGAAEALKTFSVHYRKLRGN